MMDWIIVAVLANFFWAGAIISDKILRTKFISDSLSLTALFGLSNFIPMLAAGPFLELHFPEWGIFSAAILAGALILLAMLPYVRALSFEEASRVAPMWSTIPVFVLVMAHFFLGERLTQTNYFAFAFLLIGGILVSIKKAKETLKFKFSAAFWLMLLSSVSLAVSDILLKFVYRTQSYWNGAFLVSFGSVITAAIMVLVLRKRFLKCIKGINWKTIALLAASTAGGVIGRLFYFLAVMAGSISIVTVIGGIESLFVLAYAAMLSLWMPKILKEELTGIAIITKIAAIALIFGGFASLYL